MEHDPTEHVQEHITHEAAHQGHDEHGHGGHASRWITAAALTAAFLAAFAAVAGALATSHLTQSTLIRIKANDDWNFYQAKSIKMSILDAKTYSAQLAKVAPRKKDLDKMAEYTDLENKDSLPRIQERAGLYEKVSEVQLETHETYEGSATIFHIAIAVVAIAVVAKRKEFWYVSMVLGVVGVIFFGKAYAMAPPALPEDEPAATTGAASEPKGVGKATASAVEGKSESKSHSERGAATQGGVREGGTGSMPAH